MAAIKIRVGAGVDASVATAFNPIIAAARKARAAVESELGAAGKKVGSVYRTNAAEAAKAADQAASAAEKAAKKEAQAHERALRHVAQIRERYFREEQRRQERASAAEQAAAAKSAERVGYWSTRYMARGLATAGRFGMDIARGAGVNLDLGNVIGKAVSMERLAANLSNSAVGTGVAGNEKRVAVGDLLKQSRDVGIAMGFDPEKVLEGLAKFVAKTGDLKTGRDMLADLAKLSSATGSELDDMVDAAGDVSNALGEVPNKGKVVESVMRAIAGQGKVGAVEMKDLAVQMAKLGAAAGAFEGDPAKNVETMGILAQMSRARGGSASATQAATSVASMVNILKTPARVKAFKEAGLSDSDLYNDKGLLRDPLEIMKKSFLAAGTDPTALKKMWANTGGARAVEGFATVFRQAGGGQKGIDAVNAEIDRLRKASMSAAAVEEANAARMETNAAKIEQFNAKLTEIGARVAGKVLPQLEKLGPHVLSAVDGLGRLVAWVAENPLKSAFALLGASIARAGAETVIRAGIESLIKKAAEGGVGGAAGKGLSAAGSALTIAAAAVTIEQVGELIIDKVLDSSNSAEDKRRNADLALADAHSIAKGAIRTGTMSPEDKAAFDAQVAQLQQRIKNAQDAPGGGSYESSGDVLKMYLKAAYNYVAGGQDLASIKASVADKQALPDMQAQLVALQGMQTILAGTVKVQVVGGIPGVGGAPAVDQGNRTGPSR